MSPETKDEKKNEPRDPRDVQIGTLPVNHPRAGYVSPDLSFRTKSGPIPDEEQKWHDEREKRREKEIEQVEKAEEKAVKEEQEEREKEAEERQKALRVSGSALVPTVDAPIEGSHKKDDKK